MTGESRTLRQDAGEEVLLVTSGSPAFLTRAEEIVVDAVSPGALIHYLLSPNQELLANDLAARGLPVTRHPRGLLASIRWLFAFPRKRFRRVVVLFTGERWYRRLKVLGFLLAFPNGLVLNENGDYCRPTPACLYRHLKWRFSQRLARSWHLARSGWNLLRREGVRPVLRRTSVRFPASGRLRSGFALAALPRFRKIRFPAAEAPELSIIVPAFNKWRFTYRCLASVVRHTRDVAYEVVLVDNASSDRTMKVRTWAKGVRVLRLPENRGFVEACNAGAAQARGDKLLFLNNDTATTPGWAAALLATAAARPNWGAVGAKLLFPNGKLQEAGGIVWRDGSAWNYGKFDDPNRPEYNYVREVDYCSAAALLVRREAFDEVGGLDQGYSPGYWEDTDLCFALRRAGYSVWYQPASEVYHYEGASSGTDQTQGMKRFQALHADLFRRKWQNELRHQPPFDIRSLFRARDRKSGRTVMVFDHYVPTPDRDAGSAFMARFLETVSDLGYRVLFWPDNLFRTPGYAEALQAEGIEVLYGPLSVRDFFETLGVFIDLVIAYRSPIAIKCLPPTRRHSRAQAYIAVDLEHLREERRSDMEGDGASRAEALRARERALVDLTDCVGVHSPVERSILESEFGARNVVHLPLPVPSAPITEAPFESRSGVLFVGSTHPPNVDALRHFVREVFPTIRTRCPDIEMSIVGDVCGSVPELANEPGIRLMGFARDLQPYFEQARVFVAPLRYGAGIKGKVLGAMNAGVPVVTTPIGAEGIDIVPGRSAFVEAETNGFATAVCRLNTEPELWQSMRASGRALIAEQFSFDDFRSSVAELMARLDAAADGVAMPAAASHSESA